MKKYSFPLFLVAAIAGVLVMPLSAIETPADNTPPPAAAVGHTPAVGSDEAPASDKPIKQNTGYLGIVAAELPDMLAEHLNLKTGEGVIVRSLAPDGPAAKAGVTVNDVITKVAGQAVGSQLDVSREMASHKPGDSVKLDVIHQGKPGNLDVTLSNRPDEIGQAQAAPLEQELPLDGIPKDMADRIRGAIQGNLGEEKIPMLPNMDEIKKRMQLQLNGMRKIDGADIPNSGESHSNATIRMMDQDGSIEIKTVDNDGKEVTLRDKNNKIIWSGPWDTEQDKAAAPPEVQKKAQMFNFNSTLNGGRGGIQLHFGGGIPQPAMPPVVPPAEENKPEK